MAKKKRVTHSDLEKVARLSIEEVEEAMRRPVLAFIQKEKDMNKRQQSRARVTLPTGHKVKTKSQRYHLFMTQPNVCAGCGMKATHYLLEISRNARPGASPHLNLYGTSESGKEVLFTKDHIIPRSKGGEDSLENYQIMCTTCNNKKGDKTNWKWERK